MEAKKTGLQRLREPFPEHQISLLPKPTKRDAPKGKCNVCGGWHGLPAVHLSYVGHAALTDRLLECDESWSWEPVAFGPDGLPLLDRDGGMWIRLTVCGVTRLGYGDAQGKTGPDAMKERIGDALRNAAMRFGAALDLWHKGDLHKDQNEEDEVKIIDPTPVDHMRESEFEELEIAVKECDEGEQAQSIIKGSWKRLSPGMRNDIMSVYNERFAKPVVA
jgi:hypothetical protein